MPDHRAFSAACCVVWISRLAATPKLAGCHYRVAEELGAGGALAGAGKVRRESGQRLCSEGSKASCKGAPLYKPLPCGGRATELS